MSNRILVIDDDKSVRKSFMLALEDTGHLIDTASSGMEGIEKEKSDPYDLIFCDLKMPGMNGVETVRKIRNINAKVPVYFITAFHMEFFDQLVQVSQEGISFEVIQKPIDHNQILELVDNVFYRPKQFSLSSKPLGENYHFKAYVFDKNNKSKTKLEILERILTDNLNGKFTMEIIDLMDAPSLASVDQIFATPTLVRTVPDPIKKVIGDITNENKILISLDLTSIKKGSNK